MRIVSKVLLICLLPLLMAASCSPRPSSPTDIHCKPVCETQCLGLTQWDGDRDGDRLEALMELHDGEYALCNSYREACVACINTGRAAGVIQ